MRALRAISGRCSLSTGIPVALDSLFPILTSDHSGKRDEGREGGCEVGEEEAIRATAAAATPATSALAAATAASRCKESRERAMAKSRGQTCYERKKDLGGKEGDMVGGRKGRSTLEERTRNHGLAQKRANVDKIGGGSLQLLAGMSGNAWDSILKARPRQSSPSSRPSLLPRQRLLREAPTLYRMTPGKRRDYLPIVQRSCCDHIAHLIHETHVIYQEIAMPNEQSRNTRERERERERETGDFYFSIK